MLNPSYTIIDSNKAWNYCAAAAVVLPRLCAMESMRMYVSLDSSQPPGGML